MHARAETSHEPKAVWPEDIFAVLQRYRTGISTTDVAINYAFPARVTPFAELEVVNVFDRNRGRLIRLSFGARM